MPYKRFTFLTKENIDLMFLDIKLPSISGLDFIRSLKHPPKVIFTTAFTEHAALSYELEAVDYLVKPITYERFLKSLDKFLKIQPKSDLFPTYTYFKISGKLMKINHLEIIYTLSKKDYIMIKTLNGMCTVHMTMKSLVQLLPNTIFIRVHRSYIININHILSVGKFDIDLVQKKVPIGENYKSAVDDLQKFLLEKNKTNSIK